MPPSPLATRSDPKPTHPHPLLPLPRQIPNFCFQYGAPTRATGDVPTSAFPASCLNWASSVRIRAPGRDYTAVYLYTP